MTNESDMEWNGLAGFTRTGSPAAAAAQLAVKPNLFPLVRTYLGQCNSNHTESSSPPF